MSRGDAGKEKKAVIDLVGAHLLQDFNANLGKQDSSE